MGNEILKNIYPRISIVTPVKNGVKYIEETMLSVINQGYPNLEYIVIDGGSTDGTVEIIKKYEKHISYWVSEPDNGIYDAINKGFAKSTGEIMNWLCASDIYLPKSLFVVAEIFNTFPEVEWITGIMSTMIDGSGIVWSGILPRFNRILYLSNVQSVIGQESTFWRRSLWEKSGGCDSNMKYGGDFKLWIKFLKHATLFSVHTVLGVYRRSEDSGVLVYAEKRLKEIKEAIDEEIKNNAQLSQKIFCIKKRAKYDGFFDRFPLIRSLWWRIFRNIVFPGLDEPLPPVIVWDFEQKKWVMKK